jgi:hypothetical protein
MTMSDIVNCTITIFQVLVVFSGIAILFSIMNDYVHTKGYSIMFGTTSILMFMSILLFKGMV